MTAHDGDGERLRFVPHVRGPHVPSYLDPTLEGTKTGRSGRIGPPGSGRGRVGTGGGVVVQAHVYVPNHPLLGSVAGDDSG